MVVVAIIGLLASVVVVATGNARLKSRDAKRLTDIQQIKSGLDLYFSHGSGFPPTADWNTAQAALGSLSCSGTVLLKVPQDPLNVGNPSYVYTYSQGGSVLTGCGGSVYTNYYVRFTTEAATAYGAAGTYYLSPNGITTTAPF